MRIKIFEDGPHPSKKAAMKNAIESFISFYKANNLTSKDIVAIVPLIEDSQFGYKVTLWTMLEG